MTAILVFLTALVPVLFLGMALVELLLRAAPLRGKRPDCPGRITPSHQTVRVVTAEGRLLRGTPAQIVRQLARSGLPDAPRGWVSAARAQEALQRWESAGYLLVRFEWS